MDGQDYYVYLHRKATNNEVFYVGKGKRDRAKSKTGRNKWWQKIVKKYGYIIEFVEKGLSEQSAFDLEVETIKFYRENGHVLCNLTDGGEGVSGLVITEAHRKKISDSRKGWKVSEETKKKLSDSNIRGASVICSNGLIFKNISQASQWLKEQNSGGHSRAAIQSCCAGRSLTCGGYRWRYIVDGVIDESNHDHPISTPIQKTKGEVRTVYCSNGFTFSDVKRATEWVRQTTGIKAHCSYISKCCKVGGECYGFRWSYSETLHSNLYQKCA